MTNDYIKLEFLSQPKNDEMAQKAVAAFAYRLEPSLEVLQDIRTVVSEAVTNAIAHAYRTGPGRVWIHARILKENELVITVRDWGCGIENIHQAMRPLFTSGGPGFSGMGFTIMETFMDKVTVRSTPGKGTTVTMRKRI